MIDLYAFGDPVTTVLTGVLLTLLVLMVALPAMFLASRRILHLRFPAPTLRWLYLAWALALASGLVYEIPQEINFSASEAGPNNFIRLALLLLALLTIVLIGARYRFAFVSEFTSGVLGILLIFALWGALSTLWSELPALTLYKTFEYLVMVLLFATAVFLIRVNATNPRNQLLALKSLFDWQWFLVFLLLTTVYLGVLLWPQYALVLEVGVLNFQIRGALPWISSNTVGELGAILGAVALAKMALWREHRTFYLLIFVFSIATLILAQGRSSIVGFLVAVGVVLAASRRIGWLVLFAGSLVAAVFSGASVLLYVYFVRGQTENLRSLNSRVDYWDATLQAVREHPIDGYGAYAGGRSITRAALGEDQTASTVHNAYVETLAGTGAVGLLILLVVVGAAWVWLLKLRSYVTSDPVGRLLWVESLGVFSILTVRSFFSVTFIWPPILTFGLVLVFISVVHRQAIRASGKRIRTAQPPRRRVRAVTT